MYFLGVFILGIFLATYITPIIRRAATEFGVLDRPDGQLKTHHAPVAYLGGIAVYLAFILTLSLLFEFSAELLGLLLGGTIICMLGLFDDLKVLTPWQKIIGQLFAVWVLLRSHIEIHLVALPVWFAIPLTVLWLLTVTNALNLIDVSDGLATGCAAISAFTIFILAYLQGDLTFALAALTFSATLLGFLLYNKPPATIYLGDAGSLFLGFMLAAMTLLGRYTSQSILGVLAPLFILSVPLLELTLLVIARLAKKQSPFKGSPDHFAIRLKRHGYTAKQVCAIAHGLNILGCGIGFALTRTSFANAQIIAVSGFVFFCLVWAWFWRLKV